MCIRLPRVLISHARRTATRNPPTMSSASAKAQVSERIAATDAPCIVKTQRLIRTTPGTISLAQGVVHWRPPESALQEAARLVREDGTINSYGADEGLPVLRERLKRKIQSENGLEGYNVMVTAGANQAFVNLAVALCDSSDAVVFFKPYYFNHLMAIQMTGGGPNVVYGSCDPCTLHPDLNWLESALSAPKKPKMVVVVNPCNPTGVLMSKAEMTRLSDMCETAGVWLVVDNTYELFVYDGLQHYCPSGPHVVHIFSFSKAYGMMGWRMGYLAYPDIDGQETLGAQLLKVQDTIPICPPQLSQHVALGAMDAGLEWVKTRIASLSENRHLVLDALSPLGSRGNGIAGGEGAIYFWAKLPEGCCDERVAEWLVQKHQVCLIPGAACGMPGYIRASFANLTPEKCRDAAGRLKKGLAELVENGSSILKEE